ncbi:transcriptional regulator [Chania multitudinisentens RB-25]|uniref:Transcriptional regulator n=1 Tax=Chania multitudinisentens RB-25 TaxID=1441930 RepID=W0L439_9GAMM|nr:LysR substrate-binding domain-containing protein [Chania multitudinisentens]AHG18446.1 transcriptional regulator [Chania multitudinisentens RB-25]
MKRMFPGTRALRTFAAAARHLNFTHAADELGLTPAAVSYQIKEIETQLDIRLFSRTSRSIQLTPAGALLFEATTTALDTLQRATSNAKRISRGASHLHISLGARFATNWLLPRLPKFRAAHPHLELTFDISDQLRDFDADDVDIAIRFGAGNYRGAHAERLFDTAIVPVCNPELLASGIRLKEPRDLLQQTLCYVDCKVENLVWPNWRMWMAAAGIENFDDSRCLAFSESSHVVQAVIEGGAIGLIELAMVNNEIAQGRLIQLFDIGVSLGKDYAYHLVYPESSFEDWRIVAFRQWMLQQSRLQKS